MKNRKHNNMPLTDAIFYTQNVLKSWEAFCESHRKFAKSLEIISNAHKIEDEVLWEQRDGTKIRIPEMTTAHIQNSLHMLKQNSKNALLGNALFAYYKKVIKAMYAELASREILALANAQDIVFDNITKYNF